MIKFVLFLLIVVISFDFHSFANEKMDEKKIIETLASTFQSFEEGKGEAIWPSFQLADKPTILHFAGGSMYAMGSSLELSSWEMQSYGNFPVLFHKEPSNQLPAFDTAYPLEGKEVVVFRLDQIESSLSILTFIHERFHQYQFQNFEKEKVAPPVLADYQNPFILTWMELEQRLLALFLKAKTDDEKMEHIRNYLAVNKRRRLAIHPHSVRWENHQQKMEGLADYVSVKASQLIPELANIDAEKYLLEMRKKKNSGVIFTPQDAMKGVHYFEGAVIGWALDFYGVENWKKLIEKEKVSLFDLLSSYLQMNDDEMNERLARVKKEFQWEEIHHQIEKCFEQSREQSEKIIKTFIEQEGVSINIGIPSGRMSAGGHHQKAISMNDGQKALIEDSSLASTQDQTWTLRFTKIPLVFEEKNGRRCLKMNDRVEIELDGKMTSLANLLQGNQEMHFSSLSLKNDYCDLHSQRPGRILIEQGQIFLQFE